jgi:hypothetical protein
VTHRFARILLAALLPLGFLSGCAEGRAPTAVVTTSVRTAVTSTTTSGMDLSQVAKFVRPPVDTVGFVKAWIGPAGGRVEFLKKYAIEVPAGAVDRVTAFTIRVRVGKEEQNYAEAEFLPHGTFNVPVFVEVPYYGTDVYGQSTEVIWWNSATSVWQPMGGGITADGLRVRTSTSHFSDYGTKAATSASGTFTAGAGA